MLPTVTIRGLTSEGAGVGSLPDGRAVFVHQSAPGDRIRVELTHEKRRWARGRIAELLEPGPGRRDAPCPHAGRCGGCTFEHLEYEVQLDAKRTRIDDALTRIGGLEALPPIEMHAAPHEFRYRNRVSFTLRRLGGDRVVAGFHHLESPGHIVDLGGECLLPEAALAKLWEEIRKAWGVGAAHLPSGDRLRLTLRSLSDGSGLLLVEGGIRGGDPGRLVAAVPGLRSVWGAPEQGARPTLLSGEDGAMEEWFGERLPIRPGAFLQVNRRAAEDLHALVLREIGRPRGLRIVDAYCGFGVYGRRLARHGARAVGIELDPGAVEMSREVPVKGFRLIEGPVEGHMESVLPADRVILNPPRGGVDEAVTEALARTPPERLIYVSCDPSTLARDLARLEVPRRLRVTRIQGVDLFPQTPHVETIVTLDAGEADGPGSPSPEGNPRTRG